MSKSPDQRQSIDYQRAKPSGAGNGGESSAVKSSGLERSAAGNFNPWLVAVIVSMATFMEVLDTSIANVALQHIAGGLAASQDESTWVLTSYLVSNAIILPISGWLATVIGRKRFYMICVGVFGISSLLCGFATSLPMLIFFRVLQGIGGGGLAPSEQSILADSFPPEKRGQAFALYSVAVIVAPTLGPTLGGWITDNYSWRWIFLINVPVCILSLLLSGWVLTDPPAVEEDRKKALKGGLRVDLLGFLLVALGLGLMQVVLDKGQEKDWFETWWVLSFTIISILSLVGLIVWELIHDDPIVDIPLFKSAGFAAAAGVMFVLGFILLSSTQLLPQFAQDILHYNATQAGLSLTAGGVATLMVAPLIGGLLKFIQAKYLIITGLLIEAVACYHLSGLTTQVSFSYLAWGRIGQAIGIPFLFVPITTAAYAGLPPEKSNSASAIINSMRNLGGSFGISFGVTLLARREQRHHAQLTEMVSPFSSTPLPSLSGLQNYINEQARMFSYVEIFRILALIALVAVPLAFVLNRENKDAPPAGH